MMMGNCLIDIVSFWQNKNLIWQINCHGFLASASLSNWRFPIF